MTITEILTSSLGSKFKLNLLMSLKITEYRLCHNNNNSTSWSNSWILPFNPFRYIYFLLFFFTYSLISKKMASFLIILRLHGLLDLAYFFILVFYCFNCLLLCPLVRGEFLPWGYVMDTWHLKLDRWDQQQLLVTYIHGPG